MGCPGADARGRAGQTRRESFRIGYVAGLAYYLASLYWLLLIPYRWHSIPLGPAAGWLSLSAYLALYPATWVWLLSEGRPGTAGGRPKLSGHGVTGLPLRGSTGWAE